MPFSISRSMYSCHMYKRLCASDNGSHKANTYENFNCGDIFTLSSSDPIPFVQRGIHKFKDII